MIQKKVVKLFAFFLILLLPVLSMAADLVTLDTRQGVKQSFILMKPNKPVASVILFAGGHGNLKLSSSFASPTIGWGKANFLVRTRELFVAQGFMVAVIDAPSDKKGNDGMLGGFRDSPDHVADINKVISYLRDKENVPVWLIGTSRGTESAAHIAIHSTQNPDGLVLTSSITVKNKNGTAVTDMKIGKITGPVLVIAHEKDQCWTTPPDGAETIKEQLSSAKNVKLKYFQGGSRPKSKPCGALSYHGFFGIEKEVVNFISEFIKAN